MTEIRSLAIREILELVPRRFLDERGFFSEVWKENELRQYGIDVSFVQDNHSLSCEAGVLRGLHYQAPPFAQAKLVRVVRGSIYDVAVDIRHGSATFGQWVGLTLSGSSWNQVFVPAGFAHGFLTLEPDSEVIYKVSQYYSPEHDRAIRWDDPEIGIDWPITGAAPILSAKDRVAPSLAEVEPAFHFGGSA